MSGKVVLVRYSEIAVKGKRTRSRMERLLMKSLREAMEHRGARGRISASDGRIFVWSPSDEEAVLRAASRVFGVKSASPAVAIRFKGLEDLVEKSREYFSPKVSGKVFRVRARRAGSHDFTSKDVERLLGSALLDSGALRVDLVNPEYTAYVEVRGATAYLYDRVVAGPGGLPIGSEGEVLVLFSGGFDSTVAAWRLMKRGSPVHLVHYDLGFPETVEIAVEAARLLASEWAHGYKPMLYIVNFKGPSRIVNGLVRPEYRTLVVRRLMLLHAEKLARSLGIEALATGESIGQVSSQTIRNLMLISKGLKLPVLRPLAGHDKDEIVRESMYIGTHDINARQVEVCGVESPPTPQGDEKIFEEEFDKVRDVIVPEPRLLDLTSHSDSPLHL